MTRAELRGVHGPQVTTTFDYEDGKLAEAERIYYLYTKKYIWNEVLVWIGIERRVQQVRSHESFQFHVRPLEEDERIRHKEYLQTLSPDMLIHVTLDDAPEAREDAIIYSPTEVIEALPEMIPVAMEKKRAHEELVRSIQEQKQRQLREN